MEPPKKKTNTTPYASLLSTYREPQVLKRLLQAAQRFKGLSGMVARENEEISGALKKHHIAEKEVLE